MTTARGRGSGTSTEVDGPNRIEEIIVSCFLDLRETLSPDAARGKNECRDDVGVIYILVPNCGASGKSLADSVDLPLLGVLWHLYDCHPSRVGSNLHTLILINRLLPSE